MDDSGSMQRLSQGQQAIVSDEASRHPLNACLFRVNGIASPVRHALTVHPPHQIVSRRNLLTLNKAILRKAGEKAINVRGMAYFCIADFMRSLG